MIDFTPNPIERGILQGFLSDPRRGRDRYEVERAGGGRGKKLNRALEHLLKEGAVKRIETGVFTITGEGVDLCYRLRIPNPPE